MALYLDNEPSYFVIYHPSFNKWLYAGLDTWTTAQRQAMHFRTFEEARDYVQAIPCRYGAEVQEVAGGFSAWHW